MLTRAIPSTGEALPAIGLGTWQAFDVGPDHYVERQQVLTAFASKGGRLVDSSPMYGKAEQAIGELASRAGLVGQLFLATKVWTTGRAAGVRQMESSLTKLGVDRLDLMQVHNLVDVATHLETLAEWKRAGRVRYVGVTHYAASAHEAVERVLASERLDFLQINYSAGEPQAARRLLPMAADRGVAVIVNRPFAEGALLRRLAGRALPDWAAAIGCGSWAQLLIKWVLAHPAVTCVIPATSDRAHLDDNMQALDGSLPDAQMRAAIEEAVQASRG